MILIVSAWSIAVVFLHEIVEFTWIVLPVLPVTLIGIAVSLYLGFKSVSAYNRWWEARTAIGSISGCSREWAMHVQNLIYKDTETVKAEVEKTIQSPPRLGLRGRLHVASKFTLETKFSERESLDIVAWAIQSQR